MLHRCRQFNTHAATDTCSLQFLVRCAGTRDQIGNATVPESMYPANTCLPPEFSKLTCLTKGVDCCAYGLWALFM
eukprot:3898336-Alexandrium_andersonii.AAC.1